MWHLHSHTLSSSEAGFAAKHPEDFSPLPCLPAWQRLDLSEVALVGTGRRQAVCCWQACEGRMRATPTFSLFNHVTPSLSLLVQLEQETPPCKSPTTLENLLQKRHLGMIWEA